jgi:hypothetical protein
MIWKRVEGGEWVLLVAGRGEVARIRKTAPSPGWPNGEYRLVNLAGSIRIFDRLAKAKRCGVSTWNRAERMYLAGLHVMRF